MLPIKYAIWYNGGGGWYYPRTCSCDWQRADGTFLWLSGKSSWGTGEPAVDVCTKLLGQQPGQLAVPPTDIYNNINGWNLEMIRYEPPPTIPPGPG